MIDRSDRRNLKRSFGLSIGLHAVVLPLMFAIFWTASWGIDRQLGVSYAKLEQTRISYLRIERRPRPKPAPPERARRDPAPAPRSAPAIVARPPEITHHVVKRAAAERPALDVATLSMRHPKLSLTVAQKPAEPGPPAVATPLERAPAAVSQPIATTSPTPLPSPSASPAVVAEEKSARGLDVPPGGWGQSFAHPLVADDGALTDLRNRYPEAWHASVEVGDDGRPTRVTVPSGVPEDVRADIERRLMEMRYVPAECNGLRCAGTLQL